MPVALVIASGGGQLPRKRRSGLLYRHRHGHHVDAELAGDRPPEEPVDEIDSPGQQLPADQRVAACDAARCADPVDVVGAAALIPAFFPDARLRPVMDKYEVLRAGPVAPAVDVGDPVPLVAGPVLTSRSLRLFVAEGG